MALEGRARPAHMWACTGPAGSVLTALCGLSPAWVVFGGKTHMSPFGLSDSKCLAL